MDPLRQELSDSAVAVCRLLIQSLAMEARGARSLAHALREEAATLLLRIAELERRLHRGAA